MELVDEIFVPSDKDAEYAKACVRTLARGFAVDSRVTMQREDDSEAIEIPAAVFNVLLKVLSLMSEGRPFTLVSMNEELSTQQAADILNVSKPFLNKILELGDISHRKVGGNRRVKFSDVLAYKKQQDRCSKDSLKELADEAQELNMGY